METRKKSIWPIMLTAVAALGIGYGIGGVMKGRTPLTSLDNDNNAMPLAQNKAAWESKSLEELTMSLSNVMLPEEEYEKLSDAIFQSAMGLFMAQAQGAGLTVNEKAENDLKKSIEEKYSRQYFTNMNASSMKELTKDELVTILSFYGTVAGVKFLKLSPKIIETTMTSVQGDLAKWLPTAVDNVMASLKGDKAPIKGGIEAKEKVGEAKPTAP